MQTFLPYPSFARSAAILDRQRLGKQRVEGLQLLKGQWKHHPAGIMWRGHYGALADYVSTICREWIRRGYEDTCLEQVSKLRRKNLSWNSLLPDWMGDVEFHRAHRSNLLRKDPLCYGPIFEVGLPNDLPYIWPGSEP